MRTARCIHKNCYNQATFLFNITKKFPKNSYNLRTITQEENMKARQMTPSFNLILRQLFVTFTFVFEKDQHSFSYGSSFGSSNAWFFD